MADTKAQVQELEALKASMEAAAKESDRMFTAAAKAAGSSQKAMMALAQIYESMAQNESELLKSTIKKNEATKKFLDLKEQEETASTAQLEIIKKQSAEQKQAIIEANKQIDISERQVKAQKEYLGQLGQTKGFLKGIISDQVTAFRGYLGSTAAIKNGFDGLFNSVKKVAAISIAEGSYFGMSGSFLKDSLTLAGATAAYSVQATRATADAVALGHSQEEANDSFQKFARITKSSGMVDRSAEMRDYTVVASQLATVLGVSLGEATDYMVQSQLKFGRAGAQTASVLLSIQQATEKTNLDFGHTVIQARDVTKVLFDLGAESTSLVQDQKLLGQVMVNNMTLLQAQGSNYNMALKSSTDYIKKLTTQAPDWAKIFAGRNLVQSLGNSFQEISPAILASLEKAKPGITASLKAAYEDTSLDPFSRQQLIQGMLSETQVGMDAMNKAMLDTVRIHEVGAQQRIMALWHITDPQEAQQQLKMLTAKEKEFEFSKLTTEQAKEQYGLSEEQFEIYKKQGNEAEVTALVQGKAIEEAKKAQKDSEVETEKIRVKALKAAIEQRDVIKKGIETQGRPPDKAQKEMLQAWDAKVAELESQGSQISETKKYLAEKTSALTVWSGGFLKKLGVLLTNDLTKVLVGAASWVLMWQTGQQQLATLKNIEIKMGSGGIGRGAAGGVSDEGTQNLLKRGWTTSKDIFKALKEGKGIGKIGGVAKAIWSGAKGAIGDLLKDVGISGAEQIAAKTAATGVAKQGLGNIAKAGLRNLTGAFIAGESITAVINAIENREKIKQGWDKGAITGLKETFKQSVGKINIGQAVGSLIGATAGSAVSPGVGTFAGGFAGGIAGKEIAERFGIGDINSLFGLEETPANTATQTAEPIPGQVNPGTAAPGGGSGGTPTSSKIVNDSQGSWLEQMFTTRLSLAPAFAHANTLSAKNAYSA